MSNKLVVGNWKLHGSRRENDCFFDAIDAVPGVDVAVCVPFPFLAQAQARLNGVFLGAQTVSEFRSGAYTGEVSAAMLHDFDCRYAIVGHSERRSIFHETDAEVGRKALAALDADIVPILCVGETQTERNDGLAVNVVERQLDAVLSVVGRKSFDKLVVAYEPVWAIGTGLTASPDDVGAMHGKIRSWMSRQGICADDVRILYGGSVKPANAADLFAVKDVDGGLIGGASLVAEDFTAICRAAVA